MLGGLPARNIAKWNGMQWSLPGYGLLGTVNALAWDKNHKWLYAGGSFIEFCGEPVCRGRTMSRGVARYDVLWGSWNALNFGVSGSVNTLALDPSGILYAGGKFQTTCADINCTPGITVNNIATWNPNAPGSWSALLNGSAGVTGTVNALAWVNDSSMLLVGGSLTAAGAVPVHNLAIWISGANQWTSLFYGVDGPVYALAIDQATDSTVIGGAFLNICNSMTCSFPAEKTQVNNLALLVPSEFPNLIGMDAGVNGTVQSISIDVQSKHVYIGGKFTGSCPSNNSCTNNSSSGIIRWDYTQDFSKGSWTNLGTSGDDNATNIAVTVTWNSISHLLFVGSLFDMLGTIQAADLAVWDGNSWSKLGKDLGAGYDIRAVAVDMKGRIYIGGQFGYFGNQVAKHIAVWNPATQAWSSLSNGLDGDVLALALDSNGVLYAGGNFAYLCANPNCSQKALQVNHIAKWIWSPGGDSGSWSNVGEGVSGPVSVLALDQENILYAGGFFSRICQDETCSIPNSISANNIAVYTKNGTWSALAMGLNGMVYALAADRSNRIYAGGYFITLCGEPSCATPGQTVNRIALWTPSAGASGKWSPVGDGLNGAVFALAVDSNNILYVGGDFTTICISPGCQEQTQFTNRIVQWNGSWSTLDYGLDRSVYTIMVDDHDNLYAGGTFDGICESLLCSKPALASAFGIARWNRTSAWSALGSGVGPAFTSRVEELAYTPGTLVVGGWFSRAGGKISANFALYQTNAKIFLPMVTH
jgi:trimeric autotransporter adhesin